jgi:hypothetical protein
MLSGSSVSEIGMVAVELPCADPLRDGAANAGPRVADADPGASVAVEAGATELAKALPAAPVAATASMSAEREGAPGPATAAAL